MTRPLNPMFQVLAWAALGVVVLAGSAMVHGCARAQCPACAPIVVCDEWPPPELPSASPSTSASARMLDWSVFEDAAPAPSGSAP